MVIVPRRPDRLLGGHVGRRAQDRAAGRHLDVGLDPLGQAEVGDVGVAFGVDQDVRRLQIAVENAAHVGVVDRLGRLGQERRRGPGIGLERGELLGEVAPLDQLHAEIALAVVLADLVDRDDPRVIEQGDGLGLVLEASQLGVVGQNSGLDHLERDGPVEADLPGLVDDAHAAAAQLFLNLVVAEVADGGAARQVARGPVAVGRAGWVVGVGRPVAGGVGRGRCCVGDRPGSVRPGRLGVARRRLGRVAGARGGRHCCGVDVGRDGRITGHRLGHQAAGAEALRGVRGLYGAATRASVRVGGHGETPSGTASSQLDQPQCRNGGGEQRRMTSIVAKTPGHWIPASVPIIRGNRPKTSTARSTHSERKRGILPIAFRSDAKFTPLPTAEDSSDDDSESDDSDG